jgi:EAL domain-containing protein (putative c-di-GMP-specific phosphodiesterase class I)
MTPDPYRNQVTHAAAAVRHLGDAVRGARAFFIYRDLSDASKPSIIACHPPLTDSAMLDCFGDSEIVWESVPDGRGNSSLIGLATDSGFGNRELMAELTSLAAQSLTGTPTGMKTHAFQQLRERDVRLAVSRDEFVPFFQPIVGAAAAELCGFEALLRWHNPEEGMLPPATFLDVLEETGLIEVIGRRVIRESCDQAARWFALTGSLVPVSVNIAPMQLAAPDFCVHITQCLAAAGLPAAGLILELTENTIVADKGKTQATLQRLRDLGVRVRIDDFGTGYSALAYLHELPVSGIKLDRSWFKRLDDSAEQRAIVRAIVTLAHHMEMDVVAEGIENLSQLQRAREFGCDFVQGFGFSRPLNADQAIRYAGRHKALMT